jgi:pimeloyl-ACP methyl ester carboxylesterase
MPERVEKYMRRFQRETDEERAAAAEYKEATRHYVGVQHFHYIEGTSELNDDLEADLSDDRDLEALDAETESDGTFSARESVMRPWEWALPTPEVDLEVRGADPTDRGSEETEQPPLLFVHGLGGGAWMFEKHWLGHAASMGWPARAVSLRGHGESGGSRRRYRWTMRDYVFDVLETVRSLESRPVLIGHGFGAWIVDRVARRYPARAAVLLGPTPVSGSIDAPIQRASRMLRRWVSDEHAGPGRDDLSEGLFSERLPDDLARMYASRMTQPSWLNTIESMVPRRVEDSKGPRCVVGSSEDTRQPPAQLHDNAEALGVECELVDGGGGHLMMLDGAWKQMLEALLAWVSAHRE